jgi:hypothetical protein
MKHRAADKEDQNLNGSSNAFQDFKYLRKIDNYRDHVFARVNNRKPHALVAIIIFRHRLATADFQPQSLGKTFFSPTLSFFEISLVKLLWRLLLDCR